jgi:aminopeptidase N
MNSIMNSAILGFVLFAGSVTADAQLLFPANDTGATRSRDFHVVHYKIDLVLDDQEKEIRGSAAITLVPFLPRLDTVVLDAEELNIRRVAMDRGTDLGYRIGRATLAIALPSPASFRDTVTVTVWYSAAPHKGLYFTAPDSIDPDKPGQIWTQGEDMDSHFWFPCYDFPNDFATSEVIATVRSGFTVLSNGRLVSVREEKKNGTTTYHWREDKPHATYLISLAAGHYAILKDRAGKVPLEYYVYPDDTADARICFAQTPAKLAFFARKTGFPYPWEKYAQVLIADFIEGGMENVSATSLMDVITVLDARARLDESPTSVIAHELAHQWWGDVVTCKNWQHLWLNEGFASYFDPLYHEHWLGEDEFHQRMDEEQQKAIACDKRQGRKPMVSIGSYTDNVYSRGAAVLHMLRFVLGDTLFDRALHHYLEKHRYSPVETRDLQTSIEEATGQNLDWFFTEWVYKAGYPVFDLASSWDDTTGSLRISVHQSQPQDSLTGVFRTPVDIEVRTAAGSRTHRVNILSADTTLVFHETQRPLLVQFDPEDWLLKAVHWQRPPEEWVRAVEYSSNPVERIRALKHLSGLADNAGYLPLCSRAALDDPFWSVREAAVSSLEDLETGGNKDSVRAVLLKAARDPNSRVRAAAVRELSMFEGIDVVRGLQSAVRDSSARVVAGALYALSRVDSAVAVPMVTAYLDTPSYRDIVATTALAALARLDSSRGIAAAFTKARQGKSTYSRYTALEILKKNRRGDREVKNLYLRFLQARSEFMRSYAAHSLGEIGDTTALPALTKLAGNKDDGAAQAARESIEMLRAKSSGEPVR